MSDEPTNKELRAELKELSGKLGTEITPASSKAELMKQLEELRAQLAARAADAVPSDVGAVPSGLAQPDGAAPTGTPLAEEDASDDQDDQEGREPNAALELELAALEEENELVAGRVRYLLDGGMPPVMVDGRDMAPDPFEVAELAGARAFVRTMAQHFRRSSKPAIAAELELRAEAFERHMGRVSGYVVAPGRSLSTKRGMLGPGEKLEPDDVDAARVDRLVEKGVLVRS